MFFPATRLNTLGSLMRNSLDLADGHSEQCALMGYECGLCPKLLNYLEAVHHADFERFPQKASPDERSDIRGLRLGLSRRTRLLSHRPIFENHNPVWGRAADEFSGGGAPDIVLLNRAKRSGRQTPQPSYTARRASIAGDNSQTKNREALTRRADERGAIRHFQFGQGGGYRFRKSSTHPMSYELRRPEIS
jgi:hypothetical protein